MGRISLCRGFAFFVLTTRTVHTIHSLKGLYSILFCSLPSAAGGEHRRRAAGATVLVGSGIPQKPANTEPCKLLCMQCRLMPSEGLALLQQPACLSSRADCLQCWPYDKVVTSARLSRLKIPIPTSLRMMAAKAHLTRVMSLHSGFFHCPSHISSQGHACSECKRI